MRYLLLTLLIIVNSKLTHAQDTTITKAPALYPGWTLWVPGATHFYDKNYTKGVIFSATEVGGITLGLLYDSKLSSGSTSPYYNFPLLLGLQAYNVDKCDWLRNLLEYNQYHHPDFKYDPISFNQLMLAPFKPENILTPITGCFVMLAIAELYFEGRGANHSYGDVKQMYFIDRYIDKNKALPIYGATSLAVSWGAGVAEEYYFRNGFMPIFDYKYGQKKGLIYSSLLFGSLHFANVMFANKPDYKAALFQVAEASLAGYFLGRDVQKRGYKIGPAVAAHTWYDFTLMLGSFLINPDNNVFGINVRFTID